MSKMRFTSVQQSSSHQRTERGQSIVEFAFLLLPFLLVTLGVIEIGRAWSVKQAITNSAREGARVLVLPYGTERRCPDIDCTTAVSVTVAALETTRFYLASAGISTESGVTDISVIKERIDNAGKVITEPLTTDPFSGDYVGVKIEYKYSSILQGFFGEGTGTFTMSSVSVMRHE